jgi:predicted nucleic acid-binding protein
LTPILLDSSVIVALLDRRDAGHKRCVAAIERVDQPLATCEAVVTESCHLLSHIPRASMEVLRNLEHGTFQIGFALSDNVNAIHTLMAKYADTPASLADACLIHMANQLSTGDILTLDSDFLHYRWRKTRRFNLLIPLG